MRGTGKVPFRYARAYAVPIDFPMIFPHFLIWFFIDSLLYCLLPGFSFIACCIITWCMVDYLVYTSPTRVDIALLFFQKAKGTTSKRRRQDLSLKERGEVLKKQVHKTPKEIQSRPRDASEY